MLSLSIRIWSSHQSIRTSYSSCIDVVVLNSYTMHVFLTGYDSMLAVTLITIVGAMMVHVFRPGGCRGARTNAMARFARLIFSFLRAAQKRASPAKTAGFPREQPQMTMKILALLGLAATATNAVELTHANYDELTSGKTVLIKFLAPW